MLDDLLLHNNSISLKLDLPISSIFSYWQKKRMSERFTIKKKEANRKEKKELLKPYLY
jgi:hypothetical protein